VFTSDGGNTWSTKLKTTNYLISIYFISPSIGWAIARSNNTIFKTTDGGDTWTEQSIDASFPLSSLYFISSQKGWIIAGNEIFKTNDGGSTWHKQIWAGYTYLNDIAFTSETDGWIIGGNGLILKTTDGGGIVSVENKDISHIPTDFSLSQNYPNPFNPTTTIKYQLPSAGHVTLKVYDMLGREVATLVNEEKAPGNYEVTFDANHSEQCRGMASGVYFYRLQAGNFSETKKFVLMK
jgi:hypothetical protein